MACWLSHLQRNARARGAACALVLLVAGIVLSRLWSRGGTAKGIEFPDGRKLKAELTIVFPNWKPQGLMRGLPISDGVGFVVTDMRIRNPSGPEVFACGDAAVLTVPKLGAMGHQEYEIVGRQIARDIAMMEHAKADAPWMPEVVCIGDIGGGQAFCSHATSWSGGNIQELRRGRLLYAQKLARKEMFFRNHGRVPNRGLPVAEWLAGRVKV